MTLLRTICWYIYLISSLLMSLIKYYKIIKLKKVNTPKSIIDNKVHSFCSDWAKKLVDKTKSNVNVIGLKNIPQNTNVLYVSNHQSDFDILLILAFLPKPKGFIAKIELVKIPIVSKWMQLMHCLFIDRKDMRSTTKTIVEGIDALKNGHTLVIFPEGTRSKNPRMNEFKQGSFKLALKSDVPIVPITLNNSYLMLTKFLIKKTDITITVHEPIFPNKLSKEEINNLSENVKNVIKDSIL